MPGEQNKGAAEDLVLGNLGLNREDLGMDRGGDIGADDTGGDEGFTREERVRDRPDQQQRDGQRDGDRRQSDDERQLDDLGDSHTRPFAQTAEVKPDGKGNLVDSQGTIVARAGREARLYQTAYKKGEQARVGGIQHQLNERTGQLREAAVLLNQINTEMKELKARSKAVEDLGVPADKMVEAMTLYKNLSGDFGGTLKRLLTRAAANGINVAEFGTGPDVKALADLVKEEVGKLVKPLQDRSEEQRKREEIETRQRQQAESAQREVDTFFAQNRDAMPYARVLQKLAAHPDYQGKSLNEMWLAVQLHLARFPHQRRQPNPGQNRSLPSGRGQPEGGNSKLAPVNATYDEILRDVFRDQGI
jgi:hypothetical protein